MAKGLESIFVRYGVLFTFNVAALVQLVMLLIERHFHVIPTYVFLLAVDCAYLVAVRRHGSAKL